MVSSMNRLTCTLALLVLLSINLAGCAASSRAPSHPETAARPTSITPIPADKLIPATDASGAFQVMVGPDKGAIRPFTRTFKNGKWVIFEKGDHRGFYHLDKQGRIILDREDDLHENVQVDYDPGIVVLPAIVGNGSPLPSGKVTMIVKNLKTGRQRDHGTCTYQLTRIRREKLTTPAGTFDTYLVEQKRHLVLNLASVDLTIHTAYAPGVGTVLDTLWQTIHVLGLLTTHSYRRVERAR